MKLEDVPEMVEDWRSGELRLRDVIWLLLNLTEHHEVDEVLAPLPDDLRDSFVADVREWLGNDAPMHELILFDSVRGIHPGKDVIATKLRQWLSKQAPATS